MPHVKLSPPPDLAVLHRTFRPRTLREGELVIKLEECWLASREHSLLVECHVIEGTLRQSFYLALHCDEDAASVRLLPRTSPEKTSGVLRAIVWLARCLEARGGTAITVTNLQAPLAIPFRVEDVAP